MPHRSRRLVITLVAIAATLGFVGVSGALEGEDPTLGEPELTCPDAEGTTDDGGVAYDVTTDDATDESADATDDATDEGEGDCEDAADTDGGSDDGTDDGTTDDGEIDVDGTDDGTAPESADVENHGAAV